METFKLGELFFVLFGAAFLGVLLYLLWWPSQSLPKHSMKLEALTILIPFKNEASQLPSLIKCLKSVLISNPLVKVQLLNDHSTDLKPQFISELDLSGQITLHNAGEKIFGKKAVLNEAIKKVSTPWILLMDADVELSDYFLDHLKMHISESDKCVLIPLSPNKRKGIVASFFDLDFLSLHFAGLKSASLGRPLLANGACMLLNRDAYIESVPLRNDWQIESGDDVFAMFAIAKKYGRKAVVASANLRRPVSVNFPSSFKTLWQQRLRWIGKTGRIENNWFKFVAITVLMMQISLIPAAILITQGQLSAFGTAVVFIVLIAEILFLAKATHQLRRIDLWVYIVPSVFIYPFYLLALGIFSTFAKPKWK